MSSFNGKIILEKVGPHTWKVHSPFEYHVGYLGSGDVIRIPKGFVTDFASAPRGLWNLFPPDGPYTAAAIVHDYLYSEQGNVPEGKLRTRKECDEIFLEAMLELEVPLWQRYIMFWAVRVFGWMVW